jgi:hypothetical protein
LAARPSSERASNAAPTRDSRSSSSTLVSSLPIETDSTAIIGPASNAFTMRMMVTPVVALLR